MLARVDDALVDLATPLRKNLVLAILTDRDPEALHVLRHSTAHATAQAVQELFPGTKVKKVNTLNVRGQKRRQGANVGYTPSWKKAVVTLTEDSKEIEFFNDMM